MTFSVFVAADMVYCEAIPSPTSWARSWLIMVCVWPFLLVPIFYSRVSDEKPGGSQQSFVLRPVVLSLLSPRCSPERCSLPGPLPPPPERGSSRPSSRPSMSSQGELSWPNRCRIALVSSIGTSGYLWPFIWFGLVGLPAIGGLVGLEQTTWLSAERHVHDGA